MSTKFVVCMMLAATFSIYGVGSEDLNEFPVVKKSVVSSSKSQAMSLPEIETLQNICLGKMHDPENVDVDADRKQLVDLYTAIVAFKDAVIMERNAGVERTNLAIKGGYGFGMLTFWLGVGMNSLYYSWSSKQ